MTNHLSCDNRRLRMLLEDGLSRQQQAEVVGHLDDCTSCQEALERLAAERSWWDELRQLHAPEGGAEYVGWGSWPLAGSDQTVALGLPGEQALGLLDPASDPGHLGRLGPFAITALLGRGGMGIVFRAFDEGLGRPVAIKVLAPAWAGSAAARKRFAREARAAATVVHPHVVTIHRVDSWKGLPFLVMAYVPGCSLQEKLDAAGPLELKEVLRIGMQAALGLAAAHEHGVVHRDIKPANILLEKGTGQALLTDFGLARAADEATLTQSGVITGTPPYMAPEQARGEPADHRADLFSLGSTLYALCAGHPPFRAESALAVLRKVCDEPAPPLREVNPAVPAWLEALIARLHAKDRALRFQSAAEVAELLGQCLAHVTGPEKVPLPRELARAVRPARRRWVRWVVLAALTVGGAGDESARRWSARDPAAVPGTPPSASPRPQRMAEDHQELDLREVQRFADALEADLKRPAPRRDFDPTEELIRKIRTGLDRLEKQLTPAVP